jgi:ATP-dependent 26S proteasome regulatory subunit
MALDTQQIKRYFNATLNTIALDSPTGSERTVIDQIASDLALPLNLDLYLWDCSQGLLQAKINTTARSGKFRSIERSPAQNYRSKGHPVEDLLRHLMAECQSGTREGKLFIIKDIYAFFNIPSPNPSLLRLATEAWFDIKRSPHKVIILHDGMETPRAFHDLVTDMVNPLPNEQETEAALTKRIEGLGKTAREQGANFTVELTDTDKKRMVRGLLGMTQEAMDDTLQLVAIQQGRFDNSTPDQISRIKKDKLAVRGVEFANEPDVDVQGMPYLSRWVQEVSPLLEPRAQEEYNLSFPRGMLIVGAGGTGKSLSVKCLARTWGLPVIVLDFGSLMSSRLGESEAKLKESLKAAESIAPCILFADEFDKAFGAAGGGGESDGGTSSRMFGYFLRWMIESKAPVFIAATANRPWGFKSELLRRFKVVYVDLPTTEARSQIWTVQLQKYKINLSEAAIATLAAESPNYTGDEIGKIVYHCAAVAFGEGRPTQVSAAELMSQMRAKPPQFENDAELESLRQWASSGGAMWAAPDPRAARSTLVDNDGDGERNVSFTEIQD